MPRKKQSGKRVSMKGVRRSRASRKASQKGKTKARKERQAVAVLEGHGKYKTKGIGKAMGSAGGAAAATALGFPMLAPMAGMAGGMLGDFAESGLGSIIQKIFGSGKYEAGTETMPLANQINKNSFLLPEIGSHVEFGTDAKGEFIRVVKREFVQDILSSTAPYSVQVTLPLTPCNTALSPWMSQLVNLFQNYSYDGLVFEFVTLTSPTIVSGVPGIQTGGYVGLITRSNPDLGPPADKQSALELQHAQTAPPWVPQCHPVECERDLANQPDLFVEGRTGLPVGASAPLYRHGVTYVVCGDQPTAGVKMGELWASQAIKVRFPSLDNPLPAFFHMQTTQITPASPLGLTPIVRAGANSGFFYVSNNTLQFPAAIGSDRTFLVYMSVGQGAATAAAGSFSVLAASSNISLNQAFTNYVVQQEASTISTTPNPGDTCSRMSCAFLIKVARVASGQTSTNQVVFANSSAIPAGPNFGDVICVEAMGSDVSAGLFAPDPVLVPYVDKTVQVLAKYLTPKVAAQLPDIEELPQRFVRAAAVSSVRGVEAEEVQINRQRQSGSYIAEGSASNDDDAALPRLSVCARRAYAAWLEDSPTATVEQQLALSDTLKRVVDQHLAGIVDRQRAEEMIKSACSVACCDHC